MKRPSRTRGLVAAPLLAAALTGALAASTATAGAAAPTLGGIHKIQHVVIVMQENRSFDSYFGTYPGANGVPMAGGHPAVCVPDPKTGQCVAPYHDQHDVNHGGPRRQTSTKRAACPTTPGRTSPTCCTGAASAGATTCSPAASPIARTTKA